MAIIFYNIITIVTERLWWNSIAITFQPSEEIVRWSLRSRSSTRPLSPPSTRHRPDSGVWDQHTPTAFKTPCKAAAGAPQDNLGRRMIPGERKPTWNKIQHAVFLHFSWNQLCDVRETDPFEQSLLSTHSCISESSSMQKPLSIESSACLRQTWSHTNNILHVKTNGMLTGKELYTTCTTILHVYLPLHCLSENTLHI